MNALVFGPNGLIGAHLVERLLKEGHKVTGASRNQKKLFSSSKYNHISIDISKKEEFKKLKGDYDIIFNLAAHIATGYSTDEAEDCLLINALGTLHILEFTVEKKIERLIHSSSVTVYGKPKRRIAYEKSPTNPIIVYGVSKLTSEMYCNMYSELHGLKITILRCSPVYGLGMSQETALPIFIEKARKNEEIALYGDGMRNQDYVYVDDVVEANMLAAEKKVTGVFNIGSGTKTTMKYLAETIVDVFDSSSKIFYDPNRAQEFSIGIDIAKARKTLGYEPKYDIKSGLQQYRSFTK
ncbi:MAG: hypothetical protein COU27_02995 [Candidatus Levybacteria bacterium CG10_big_fil_rev_8_21_14_0_10_36_7]|nr:MAG: hypothetical protein COU27_02995 [Candidatus Levybacteria bacterium CG10_big_fil_rev_8_21_14_0_10_36_7]